MADEDNMSDETMDSNMEKPESKQVKHSKHHKAAHKHAAAKQETAAKAAPKSSSKGAFNWWALGTVVFFLAAILFMILFLAKGPGNSAGGFTPVNADTAKADAADFINKNLVTAGTAVTIDSVVDSNGVYTLGVSYQGQKITSYISKDGKVFFPSGVVIADYKTAATTPTQTAQPTNVPKTDKPVVEVYVMSYCPYGTQIEKGMLPVVGLLGDKADIKIKFVDYVMHGQKESDENLRQYCIQQNYPTQYYKYLQCFLNASDSAGCRATLGFDEAKLNSCFTAADAQFGISKDYADQSTWRGSFPRFAMYEADNVKYAVQGSPTLVINGVQASSSRDPESLKQTICAAFTTAPAECNTALPTAGPSPGFGYGTSTSDSAAAGCGV
jgi:hypothetical protein